MLIAGQSVVLSEASGQPLWGKTNLGRTEFLRPGQSVKKKKKKKKPEYFKKTRISSEKGAKEGKLSAS